METNEIRIVLWALGFQPEADEVERMIAACFGISEKEAEEASFTIDEFMELMTEKISERDSSEHLLQSFRAFDAENKGVILLKDIKRVAREIDFPIKDEELEMIMAHIDKDGGGEVTSDEWIRIMADRQA